ncbi:MAG: NADH-quinone oxidoreductase subunit A [Deltaproteobacteria bacterium]|nr:NADH-quinone oxidoreductase subunit A [Deltaproteobacteria bacterium]
MNPTGMLAFYAAVAAGLVLLLVVIAGQLSPRRPSPVKQKSYECGVSEPQPTEARWPIRFALVAMLFLVFDVEGLFFYPWAVQIRELKFQGLLCMGSFFAVLGVGYIYARGRGALKWQ